MAKKKKKSKKNFESMRFISFRRGFVAAHALIGAALVATLLSGLLIFISSSFRRSTVELAQQQSLQIAESGVYFYQWYLAHSLDGMNAQQVDNFWEAGTAYGQAVPFEREAVDANAAGIGKYRLTLEVPEEGSTIVYLTSTGWTYRHPEIIRSVRVRFRRPSWSEYSVLGNNEMRFGEGTTIYGKVHSNKGIRFDGVANNLISSSVESYDDSDHDDNNYEFGVHTHVSPTDPLPPNDVPARVDVFKAGRSFPLPIIDFNGVTADLAHMRTEAQSGGIFLSGEFYEVEKNCRWRFGQHWCGCQFCGCYVCDTEQELIKGYHLTLRADDKVEIRRVLDYQGDNDQEPDTYKIMDETDPEVVSLPEKGLIYCEGHVWVDGQVNTAKVSIIAAKIDQPEDSNIYINDSILYANKNGDEIIGLIAENDISIGLYSSNNLEIDAALLAQKGRVGRDYYTESHSAQYYRRESITIYGSIATNERYGFAWTDGTGYNLRNIYFDNNLIYYPPPFFPTGVTYELDLWEDL